MGATGLGMKSHLGWGEESTYGTAVARPYFVEINNESIIKEDQRLETNSITRRGTLNTKVQQGGRSISGAFEFDCPYGGVEKLLKHAFGQIDTTSPDITNVPTAKTHTFTIADTLPTGLTFEVWRDNTNFITEANKAFVYAGGKITSMEFACAVDEILRVTCNIFGQDETRATKTTPSFYTDPLAVYHQGCLSWNTTEREVESFNISLNNNLEMRPRLCSKLTREPYPAGKVEVTGSFVTEFSSWDMYDDFVNASERAMTMTFTGPTIGGSISKSIVFTVGVSIISGCRVLLNNPGRIMMEIDFKAFRTTSANELVLAVTNTVTGA